MTATAAKVTTRLWLISVVAVIVVLVLGVCVGPVTLAPSQVFSELFSHLPWNAPNPHPTPDNAIIWQIRFPRVILAFVVGSMLASAGCAYQGTLRNPLADPYLLGISAGSGLGATVAIVLIGGSASWVLPVACFIGAMGAVFLTYTLGRSSLTGRSSTALILAGVAVSSLLTAVQTLLQQHNADKVREVYSWMLGRLNTTGWNEVRMVTPYVIVCILVLLKYRRVLDVFAVGDEEARSMGLPVNQARAVIVIAASLGTAAVVAASGLIGFVGIIVPHTLRLIVGSSYRILLPLSVFFGGVFLVLADVIGRTAMSPEEIPIGVITAALGAPFFLYILGSRQSKDIS